MPINLIDTIKPANNGSFPIAEAQDIELTDGTRLSEQLILKKVSSLPPDANEHPEYLYVVVEQSAEETTENTSSEAGGSS